MATSGATSPPRPRRRAAFLGRELDPRGAAEVAAALVVPGRFEVLDGAPVTLLDVAHNDGGIEALTQSLPAFAAGRRLVAVVSILDDKDAGGMLARLLATCDADRLHRLHQPARAAGGDARLARGPDRRRRRDRRARGARRARARARNGWGGRRRARHRLDLPDLRPAALAGLAGVRAVNDDDGPSVLVMIGAVALTVAAVILVFVGVGYLIGRLFL